MSNILQIAYTVEGKTDERFLGNIIEKTYESLLRENVTEIEIYSPVYIPGKGGDFTEIIKSIAVEYYYFDVICVHCDSDDPLPDSVFRHKIKPAFELVKNTDNTCENLVAVVPVQMTEAWMLADIDLFLKEINARKPCRDFDLPCRAHEVENLSNPKSIIESALRKAQNELPKRRGRIRLSDLYSPISRKLSIEKLEYLPSFIRFKKQARQSLINLNFLHQ